MRKTTHPLKSLKKSEAVSVVYKKRKSCMPPLRLGTAGIGRMGPPEKNDLFSISIFVTFTIITGKMYTILDHPDGNVVSKKHMHAAIHWIIRQIMTFNEKVSKNNEGIFDSARLVHPS